MMKPFLFDPCGSVTCQNCFQLSDLNLLKSKIFQQTRKNDTLKITEPRYSSRVLHGNWFEERAENNPTPDEWETSYKSLFRPYSNEKLNIACENRAALKRFQERSKGVGHETLIEHHGNAYHNNFSTAYDLAYRVLPIGLSGPSPRKYNARKGTYVPEQDLAKNFGNATGYGYKECIQRKYEQILQEAKELPRTHYSCDFTPKTMPTVKRFPRKRANMNTPDLRHLDIDLETKARPEVTHGYDRFKILEQKIHDLMARC